jgi:hypothetical protein
LWRRRRRSMIITLLAFCEEEEWLIIGHVSQLLPSNHTYICWWSWMGVGGLYVARYQICSFGFCKYLDDAISLWNSPLCSIFVCLNVDWLVHHVGNLLVATLHC